MVRMLKGRYTDQPKGYLTYPIIKDDGNSHKLQNNLLKEYHETRYLWHRGTNVTTVLKPFAEVLKLVGENIEVMKRPGTTGRDSLPVMIDGDEKIIPVEIHKMKENGEMIAIQIRVDTNDYRVLQRYMDAIQESLSKWRIQPKECFWSQGGWTEPVTVPEMNEERLKKIAKEIEDLKDQVNGLQRATLRNSMTEERKVRAAILK